MNDKRYKRVVGFLASKGLLVAPHVDFQPTAKLNVEDVLWVSKNIEPRVIEVLPAALIHFPKTFLHQERLPKELKFVIERIRRNQVTGPDYEGIRYNAMRRWALKKLATDALSQ